MKTFILDTPMPEQTLQLILTALDHARTQSSIKDAKLFIEAHDWVNQNMSEAKDESTES